MGNQSKFTSKRAVVQEALDAQAAQREEQWKQTSDKCAQAKLQYQQKVDETAERAKALREKESLKFEQTKATLQQERRAWIKKMKAEVEQSEKRSLEVREKYQKEMVHDKKDVYKEIVKQNRERLDRAEDCAREQTLQKIM